MRFYEDPQKTSRNRLPQRSYYIPENEGAYRSLNGTWRFFFDPKGEMDPQGEIPGWESIPVPSCWELYGYEEPNYTNVNYPFPVDPPYVPDENPMGIYEREIEIDPQGRKTYLVLEGASSVAQIFFNGCEIGYTSGNHLQSEFDLSDFIREGKNTLRIAVYKWGCSSYLEDQDCFRFHGIFRDVYLLLRPQGHLRDIHITTGEDSISVQMEGSALVTLLEGDRILDSQKGTGSLVFSVRDPHRWNAEDPYLYTLRFQDREEIITQKVGFRSVTFSEKREFLINSVPVKLRGVNHHDTHPNKGWVMEEEDLLKDLHLMKSLNINCIRTSHYPPTPKFLNFCDEIGFYVILETDLETHGFVHRFGNGEAHPGYDVESLDWLCRNPLWEKEYVERMMRAVERDKNHPSVVMWSTGNESGFGENHKAMMRWVRRRDPSRPVHCEDVCRKAARATSPEGRAESTFSDVYSRMYLSPAACEKLCTDPEFRQPLFLCEFSHAMGNGPGDIMDYWRLVEKYPHFIGGCVWEWADHTVVEDGVAKYGGDWKSEMTHDSNFCCDGMVFHDRSLKAGSYEVKTAYQPMKVEMIDGKPYLKNCFDFTDLSGFTVSLSVYADGEIWDRKLLNLSLAPGESKELPLPERLPQSCHYGCYLNVSLLREDGESVAFCQLELPCYRISQSVSEPPAELWEDEKEIRFEGKGIRYRFSKRQGTLTSLCLEGEEKLASPLLLSTFRAPTDNERKVKSHWISGEKELSEHSDRVFRKIYSCRLEGNTVVTEGSLSGISVMPYLHFTQRISVGERGTLTVSVEAKVNPRSFWLQRFGYEFSLQKENETFRYFGMGPGETYVDLHHYAGYGMFSSDAVREYVPYIKPQEHGNHFGVRMLSLDSGFSVISERPFECNVSQYSTEALYRTLHAAELKKDGTTHVRVDYKNSGIGSGSCGPELGEAYRLSEKEISFGFQILLETL